MSLQVEAVQGVDAEDVRKSIQAAVEKSWLGVTDNADLKVFAKNRSIACKEHHLQYAYPGSTREQQATATITPFNAMMELKHKNDVLWSQKFENMAPLFSLSMATRRCNKQ